MQLKGARVIVTGASSGIGRATALEFARRGARLALAARSETALHEVATEIRQRGGEAVVIPTDVTMAAQVERMTKETIRALGGIDVLVNNAGVGLNATIADASGGDVEALFRLNVLAAADAIRAGAAVRDDHQHLVGGRADRGAANRLLLGEQVRADGDR